MTWSGVLYVLSWILIVTGTVKSASALVTLTTGHAMFKRGKPVARTKAREELGTGLNSVAVGANGFALLSNNATAMWMAFAVLTAFIAWDLRSWLKARRRRKRLTQRLNSPDTPGYASGAVDRPAGP